MDVKELSPDQCVLLAVHYASEANIQALHTFTPARLDALSPELVLRIVLTYLPETLEPRLYTTYIGEVASRLYLDVEREDVEIDTSPVRATSPAQAKKEVKSLHLFEIKPPRFPPHAPTDILTRFLCHRAYRIESETGALDLVPQLIEPFLERSDYLRTWFISVVLPVLRLNSQYYPTDSPALSMAAFERMEGREAVDHLLDKSRSAQEQVMTRRDGVETGVLTRDTRGLVGPWMYGHTDRKRRRLEREEQPQDQMDQVSTGIQRISLTGVSDADKTGHDWEHVYRWVVENAASRFPQVTQLIEEWDGPSDVDLGQFSVATSYLDSETQQKLEAQYAQAAFAVCYAVSTDSEATIKAAHRILARLAELLDFIPPPDLATSVDNLPQIEQHAWALDESRTLDDLSPAALLLPEHPLTTPRMETYMLLQMLVYSAYQLASLGHSLSVVGVAKVHFYSSPEQQLALLKQILSGLSKSGHRDEQQWIGHRAKLLWLWSWGIKSETGDSQTGAGLLGKIPKEKFEAEMLRTLVDTSLHDVDPVANVDLAADLVEHDSSFPFKSTEDDVE